MNLVGGLANFIAKNIFSQCGVVRPDRVYERAKILQALTIPLGRTIGVGEAEASPTPDAAVKNGEHRSECFAFGAFEEDLVEIIFGFEHGLGVAGVVGCFDDGEGAFEARDLRLIGLFSEEWLRHFYVFTGGKRITPMEIATAEKNSVYWRATEQQTIFLAQFLLAAGKPDRLQDAPGGKQYLTSDQGLLDQGKTVFAER